MARNYAQIMCAIWDNADFLALSEGAQRAYFMLASQKDISAAGVLRIWTPRWAALSRTSTDESLKAALRELKTARFIVPDWVTGELLVRSFVKWDGGYKNSKRKPLIEREARAVSSLEIKLQLRVEFEKLDPPLDTTGLPEPPPPTGSDSPLDRASRVTSDGGRVSIGMGGDGASASSATAIRSEADASLSASPDTGGGVCASSDGEDSPALPFPEVDRTSDASSDVRVDTTVPFRGVVGTQVSSPVPPEPSNPQPVPPPAGTAAESDAATTAQTLVGEWIDLCRNRPPNKVIGQTSKAIKELLAEGIDPADIRAGITSWTAKGLHPAALPSVVNEVMNSSVVPFRSSSRREHQPYQNPPPEAYLEPDAWGTP